MGYSSDAQLIAGIPLSTFFSKVETKTETYDEHDAKGKKTGKKITEKKIVATLPDGNEVVIGEVGLFGRPDYDFYTSLGFEDTESDQTDLELLNRYENRNLDTIYIGYTINATNEATRVPIEEINTKILKAKLELKEKFYFDGEIGLFLVHGEYC